MGLQRTCAAASAVVALLASMSLADQHHAEPVGLEPENTHAVIIGVLRWEDTSFTTYSADRRQDRELYEALVRMGVPRRNMVLLLDEQATLARVRKSLRKAARRAKEGDSVIVYYAGHGSRSSGDVYFANYDAKADDPETTWLALSEIPNAIKSRFRDGRVMMFADCCNSGGLAQTAAELAESGLATTSLTSTTATATSTGSWTFTRTLAGVFDGSPAADRDSDGVITLAEAAEEVADAMRFHDRQLSGYSKFGISEGFLLRSARERVPGAEPPAPYDLFEYVQIRHDGFWKPARIVDYRDGTLAAELQEGDTLQVVNVDSGAVRELGNAQLPADGEDRPRPTRVLSLDEAMEKARVDGKYSGLAKRFEVEHDYRRYSEFLDYGYDRVEEYAGHHDLPEGYWVYVYPHWYIWKESHR